MNYITADTVAPYTSVEISEVEDNVLAHKLMEMGFFPGKYITLVHSAPFGDPLAFQIDDSVIALRKSEAKLIKIIAAELERAG